MQPYLNVGLDKLRATAEQVAALQSGLAEQEALLEAKNAEANLKLQQMVKDQNEAEQRKSEAETLKVELDERNAEVERRREVAEADLSKAEPALLEAQEAVKGIQRKNLDEIRVLHNPPPAIRLCLEAVIIMLTGTTEKLVWKKIRNELRGQGFITKVVDFESDELDLRRVT